MNVEVYWKDDCKWCDLAKALLKSLDIPFKAYKFNEDFTKDELIEMFTVANLDIPIPLTLPQIRIDSKFIGGFKELEQWQLSGMLVQQ